MKIKIIFPVLICLFTFCLGIFSSCLNVQIQNSMPKIIVRGLVRRTINIKGKVLAYLEELYVPKDTGGATVAKKERPDENGKGWFIYFHQSILTITAKSSPVEAVPVGTKEVR